MAPFRIVRVDTAFLSDPARQRALIAMSFPTKYRAFEFRFYVAIYINIYMFPNHLVYAFSLQAFIGRFCNFNAAGLMNPQNVTIPKITHKTFT